MKYIAGGFLEILIILSPSPPRSLPFHNIFQFQLDLAL